MLWRCCAAALLGCVKFTVLASSYQAAEYWRVAQNLAGRYHAAGTGLCALARPAAAWAVWGTQIDWQLPDYWVLATRAVALLGMA